MNNKGFTLVELIAVIAILSILVLIASISITKLLSDAKEDLSDTQIALIKTAAEAWGSDNIMDLPDAGECIYLTLGDLKEYGLLDDNVIDAKNGNKISDELQVKIISTSNKYGNPVITYEVNPDSVDGCSSAIKKSICKLESGTSKTTSAQYTCTLDKDRTFYVLGENASDSNKIDLIMDRNYVDGTVPKEMNWCVSGNNNSCNHDNLDPYIEHIQQVFGGSVEVSLPSAQQIATAAQFTGWPDKYYPDTSPQIVNKIQWLWGNLYSDSNTSLPYGYWTSTADSSYSDGAWHVYYYGHLLNSFVNHSNNNGLRPVITISKSNMD